MSVNHSTVVELEHHNIMALGERVEFTGGIRFLNPRHASYILLHRNSIATGHASY